MGDGDEPLGGFDISRERENVGEARLAKRGRHVILELARVFVPEGAGATLRIGCIHGRLDSMFYSMFKIISVIKR